MLDVTFEVARFDPAHDTAPRAQSYALAVRPAQTVLDALLEIRSTVDPTLAFRCSCRSGICGDCALTVNGVARLACETMVGEVAAAGRVQVGPLRHFRVLRDLVVDVEPFLDSLRAIVPWVVARPDHDGLMSPEAVRRVEGANACVLCGVCEAEWPSRAAARHVPGPVAMAKAYRLALDSRDALGEARLRLAVELGLLGPDIASRLQALCPKLVPFGDDIFPTLRPLAVQQE